LKFDLFDFFLLFFLRRLQLLSLNGTLNNGHSSVASADIASDNAWRDKKTGVERHRTEVGQHAVEVLSYHINGVVASLFSLNL